MKLSIYSILVAFYLTVDTYLFPSADLSSLRRRHEAGKFCHMETNSNTTWGDAWMVRECSYSFIRRSFVRRYKGICALRTETVRISPSLECTTRALTMGVGIHSSILSLHSGDPQPSIMWRTYDSKQKKSAALFCRDNRLLAQKSMRKRLRS